MEETKSKVLLVEDDSNFGNVLKNYLELNDFEVLLERDGRLGLAAFQREKFDICLLDVMMPHVDGFTLAEEIRDIDPDIPLFFLSAKTMKEDILTGYSHLRAFASSLPQRLGLLLAGLVGRVFLDHHAPCHF